MFPLHNEPYLAACDKLFCRKVTKRMHVLKRNMVIVCIATACILSLHTISQTSQVVFDRSTKIAIETAMDQPTVQTLYHSFELNSQRQESGLRKRTITSLLPSPSQQALQRALSNDVPEQEVRQQNQTSSNNIDSSLVKPNEENTIIALISMGEARSNRLAERAIRSIRAAGLYTGFIMLFTDQEGFYEYQHSLSWDPKVLVIQGREEDMTPKGDDDRPIRMRTTMIYQRFKTLIPKYASFYPEVRDAWEYALYLDIDNVVTQDLRGLFHDYHANLLEKLGRSRKSWVNATDQSFISFWKEKQHFQGGQFIVHRKFGHGCLDAWRSEFDKGKSRKDQPLLMNVHNNFDKFKCRIYVLPHGNFDKNQRGKHFNLFTGNVYNESPENYPTIVHLTGLRTRINSESSQRDFLRKALRLVKVMDPIMVGNITWEEVITPVGPKGHKPKKVKDENESQSDDGDEEQIKEDEADKGDSHASQDRTDDESAQEDVTDESEAEGDIETEVVEDIHPMISAESNLFSITITRPTNDNTAIALVVMGKAATASYIAERCIRSIRASGNFTGFIILFTDQNGYDTKRRNLAFDPKIIVIQGKDEDMEPTSADGTRIKYAGPGHMVFKRFKTLVLKYLDADTRFNDIRYALYLDVDNVVANPLSRLFDDYAASMSIRLARENSTAFSYFSLWRDPGMGRKFWQGGQIMYDRYRSTGCVDAWRNEMDTVYHPQDQPLLMNVYNNFTKYGCRVFELPNQGKHFTLLSRKIVKGITSSYPTLVHITALRTKKFKNFLDEQKAFLREALQISDKTDMMTPDISWWDVAQPIDARGRKPKKKKKKDSKVVEAQNVTVT